MDELERVLKLDETNYKVSRQKIGDSAALIQDVVDCYSLLSALIVESGIPPTDDMAAPGMLALQCRYCLVMGSLSLLRSHLYDSYVFTRRAIEACAFASKINQHPHLAMEWLESWQDEAKYEAYRKKFSASKLFPTEDVMLQKLSRRYDFCSKFSHPSIVSFGNHLKPNNQPSRFLLTFNYGQLRDEEPGEPIGTLLFTLDATLASFRYSNAYLLRQSWQARLGGNCNGTLWMGNWLHTNNDGAHTLNSSVHTPSSPVPEISE